MADIFAKMFSNCGLLGYLAALLAVIGICTVLGKLITNGEFKSAWWFGLLILAPLLLGALGTGLGYMDTIQSLKSAYGPETTLDHPNGQAAIPIMMSSSYIGVMGTCLVAVAALVGGILGKNNSSALETLIS